MNSIKVDRFVSISGVYKQHPALLLETECQTGALSTPGPAIKSRIHLFRHSRLVGE